MLQTFIVKNKFAKKLKSRKTDSPPGREADRANPEKSAPSQKEQHFGQDRSLAGFAL